jgi:hypothetical protein
MTPPPNGEGTNKPEDDPLGGIDPMAWLESLARRQGANPDELVTAADIDVPLPSLEPEQPPQPAAQMPAPAAQASVAQPTADDPLGGVDPMAWLESLARRQGANPDELVTAANIDVPLPSAEPEPPPQPVAQAPTPVAPEPVVQPTADDPLGGVDPMAWLESLARRQGANPDELVTAANIDVPLPSAEPEPPPQPVAQAPTPVAPEPIVQPTADDPLGGVDPMAWLESLARRQGANPDELVTAANIDVPLPPADAVIEERGYTEFDPFSVSTLSPSARALEQPPASSSAEDTTAWLEELTQTASIASAGDESDPMAWLASFGEPSPYDLGNLSTETPVVESMTPDAALSWLDSLSTEPESAPEKAPEPPVSAPQGISPLEAGGLSNDPQEVQAWLTEQLGSLMQAREAEENLSLADLPPAEPSASLPDWLSEAVVDPTLPSARGILEPEIKLPTPPEDLPTWLLETAEAEIDLTFSDDFIPPQAPLPQVPEASLDLDPSEIERMIKPSSPEEVDDLAEYFNEEYDRRRAGDETIPLWYLEALQRAESVAAAPPSPEPVVEPPTEPAVEGEIPSWLLEMQPSQESPAAPAPVTSQLPEELSWLEALAQGLPEETPAPPAEPAIVEPVLPSERPAWLAQTGKLDPSVVERYEAERAAEQPAPEPEPQVAPPPVPEPPPVRRVAPAARLQQARQQVAQGQVLTALESYQALVDSMENLEEVRADLRQLAERHPKEPKVRRLLGDTHMRLGDLQAALDAYLTALKEL